MFKREGWNSVFIKNHDNPRSVPRVCDDSDTWREHGAKLLALMRTWLSGTIFMYQGEEIGMRNMLKDWDVAEYQDIEFINYWKKSLELYGNDKDALKKTREVLDTKARPCGDPDVVGRLALRGLLYRECRAMDAGDG